MDAKPLTSWPLFTDNEVQAIYRLTELCAGLQKDIHTLQCQVMELEQQVKRNAQDVGNLYEGVDSLVAMRDTLSAVFTIEAPAKCGYCDGTGELGDGIHDCTECQGTGRVQS